nr:26S proteasome regulatory subunit 7-like [Saimiri boliviensis boliviensis]
MPDYLGADQRKTKEDEKDDKPIRALDEGDIALLKTYSQSTYSKQIKQVEDDIQQLLKKSNELTGIKESDTGLAPPALWDLAADKQTLQSEQPLQVARCTKIINADSENTGSKLHSFSDMNRKEAQAFSTCHTRPRHCLGQRPYPDKQGVDKGYVLF